MSAERQENVADDTPSLFPDFLPVNELPAAAPSPASRPAPWPQPRPHHEQPPQQAAPAPRPRPRPQVAVLPPAAPLPPTESLSPRSSQTRPGADASAFEFIRPSARPWNPPAPEEEPAFIREALKEIEEAKAEKARQRAKEALAVTAVAPAAPTLRAAASGGPILLEMAHPLHHELQNSKASLRSAWAAVIVLMLAMVGGIVYTAIRFDKNDQRIEQLLTALDSERSLAKTYKLEVARLYAELNDVKARNAKQQKQQGTPGQVYTSGRD